jgi:hypothetical protein
MKSEDTIVVSVDLYLIESPCPCEAWLRAKFAHPEPSPE